MKIDRRWCDCGLVKLRDTEASLRWKGKVHARERCAALGEKMKRIMEGVLWAMYVGRFKTRRIPWWRLFIWLERRVARGTAS